MESVSAGNSSVKFAVKEERLGRRQEVQEDERINGAFFFKMEETY